MPKDFCCNQMKEEIVGWNCSEHGSRYDCADALLDYISQFDEYGIIVHDGGRSIVIIIYCPWCGERLPDSKRNLWFEKLAKLGFNDPLIQDDVPEEFKTDEWYREK